MPKILNGLPKYRRHSGRELGFVEIGGKRTYFPGKYGSTENRQAYRRFCLEWETAGRPTAPQPEADQITLAELMVRYWRFASQYYVKNGRATDVGATGTAISLAVQSLLDLVFSSAARFRY